MGDMMVIEKNEVDIYDVEALYTQLLDEFKKGDIVIDMSNVNKVDMSVIQLFISAKKSSKESLKKFILQHVKPEIKNILERSACEFLIGAQDG